MSNTRVLILPGWQDSGEDHWQSRWERLHGYRRVEQNDWQWPRRGDWMARLDEVILESDLPAMLVAHSLGTHLAAAWAAHSKHTARVRGALLVAIPDVEHPEMPPQLHGWRPMVRQRLPFAAMAVLSSNDPYGALDRTEAIAADWGAGVEQIGPFGHINAESGLDDWPEGHALLLRLMADN